jgi:hypothetical protein
MEKTMKTLIVTLLLAFAFACSAQDKAKTFTPSKDHEIELTKYQKKAQDAQATLQAAQSVLNVRIDDIKQYCSQVVKEEKWPATVQCQGTIYDLHFVDTGEKVAKK